MQHEIESHKTVKLTRAIVRDKHGNKRGEYHSSKENAEIWGESRVKNLDQFQPAYKPHSVEYAV